MDGLRISEAASEPASADRLALIGEGSALDFRALAERVALVRGALEARGIKPRSRVALLVGNSVATVITLHALLDLGATIVPLHPRLTPPEAELLLADAAPALVLRDDDLATLAASPTPTSSAAIEALDPESPLAMVYTSGTTGKPKGAVLSRRAFLASAEASAANFGWTDDDRWLLCLPLCHVGGLSILTRCLVARRPIILEPRYDPGAVLAAIDGHRATMLSVVPTMLRDLLERDEQGALSRLRVLLSGGAGTPPSLLDECARRGVPLLTTYGLTEACSQIASQRPSSPYRPEPGSGRALPGAELRIVGARGDEPGNIQVRGPMLMSGYWRGEGRALDPATDDEGWFETGDLGTLDEAGRLHVASRRSDLIVTGGENVYPLEVEQVIAALPFVRAALVFGVPDERWGQVVAVALEIGGALDEDALVALFAERLAPHKRPRRLCVVESLPRKGPGKLDRAGAAERHARELRPLRRG
jgi:O-succinylbenzoic acid--CoA ligase